MKGQLHPASAAVLSLGKHRFLVFFLPLFRSRTETLVAVGAWCTEEIWCGGAIEGTVRDHGWGGGVCLERLKACRGQVMEAKPWSFILLFYGATRVFSFPFSKLSQAATRT